MIPPFGSVPAAHTCGVCGVKVDPGQPDHHVHVTDAEGKPVKVLTALEAAAEAARTLPDRQKAAEDEAKARPPAPPLIRP